MINATTPFALLVAPLGAAHAVNCLCFAFLRGGLLTLPSLVLVIALPTVLVVPFLIVV